MADQAKYLRALASLAETLIAWGRDAEAGACPPIRITTLDSGKLNPHTIREIADNYERVQAERDTYKPYYDALRAQHNGYDEEFRKATHSTEPESPEAALDELLAEADEWAVDAPGHKVISRLAAENAKLRRYLKTALARLETYEDASENADIAAILTEAG